MQINKGMVRTCKACSFPRQPPPPPTHTHTADTCTLCGKEDGDVICKFNAGAELRRRSKLHYCSIFIIVQSYMVFNHTWCFDFTFYSETNTVYRVYIFRRCKFLYKLPSLIFRTTNVCKGLNTHILPLLPIAHL